MYRLQRLFNSNINTFVHWIWVMPVILAVAFLSFRQIDLYPPTVDEFYSMYNVGWIVNGPFSPVDVLQSLAEHSANHTPGYFLLLNLWGHLVGYDVALGRALTIFTGLLSLAMIYRLTRDFVAPAAGLIAVILVTSNTFYNYFIPHQRMYPLLVFMATTVLWLYLRITTQRQAVRQRDYFALALSSYVLANVHAFSALFFAMLGAYHLLIVPKNRRWLLVSAAVAAALLLFSPWLVVLLTRGLDRTFEYWDQGTASVSQILESWYMVSFNGSRSLGIVAIAGVMAAIIKRPFPLKPHHFIVLPFVLALAAMALATDSLQVSSMRLALAGWPPLLLLVSAGLYALFRLRRWLGVLLLLWAIAGISFQTSADWERPACRARPSIQLATVACREPANIRFKSQRANPWLSNRLAPLVLASAHRLSATQSLLCES